MLDKHFNFSEREQAIYEAWEKAGIFKPEAAKDQDAPVFNISMPPPNANGELHLGHSYGYAVMDILGRFHRLQGKRVLLLPGKDHAGIQTQVVFEKRLAAAGVDVATMDRADFYRQCYDFCTDRAAYMRGQEKILGLSADWDRETFTLDPKLSEIVFDTFKKMWEDGLIYRGERIIHWSVYSQTAISDIEVEYKEEKGHLWHIAYGIPEKQATPKRAKFAYSAFDFTEIHNTHNEYYAVVGAAQTALELNTLLEKAPATEEDEPVAWLVNQCIRLENFEEVETKLKTASSSAKDKLSGLSYPLEVYSLLLDVDVSEHIIVATTRPETMLGDAGVAVHPEDQRYAHLVGKEVTIPIQNRNIKIIADDRVEMAFGTGAVKITPAHDFLDYDIGETHDLERIKVIDQKGLMTKLAGADFEGLATLECREKLVARLETEGFLVKVEEINHKVPIAERGKDVIEPLISKQWFMKVDMEGNSLRRRALKLVEEDKINIYPARSKKMFVQWLGKLRDWNISRQISWGHRMPVWYNVENREEVHVGTTAPETGNWEQETDTFDTWFSSGQWSYSTLGAQGLLDMEDIASSDYFPNHTMVMGKDILFFWACRMLLFSTYRFDTIPWKNVYFTGLVTDKNGQKMSKSKGNGIEPLSLIKEFGTDALRIGLIAGSTAGNNTRIGEQKVKGYSNFINKLWNASKFALNLLKEDDGGRIESFDELKYENSKWIIQELQKVQASVSEKLADYELFIAAQELYQFTWDVFCDWYIEIVKIHGYNPTVDKGESQKVMKLVLSQLITLLHPFIPFVTEEIYGKIPGLAKADEPILCNSAWNKIPFEVPAKEYETGIILQVVSSIRSLKNFLEIPLKDVVKISLNVSLSDESKFIVGKMAQVEMVNKAEMEALDFVMKPINNAVIYFATEKKDIYKETLKNELANLKRLIDKDAKKLNNERFVKNAPEEILEKTRAYYQDNVKNLAAIQKDIELNA